MYVDVFTLSALVDELLDTLVGGRVQDVLDVDASGVGMEIYANHKRHYLYLSADTRTPRLHVVPDRLRRGLERPTQVGLLLRRLIEGAKLTHVSQPKWERIVHLTFESAEGVYTLIVEPMERRSNLILVQDGMVLDCMRRVGADENRYRVTLPNHPYQPPPPMEGKLSPFELKVGALMGALAQNDDPKRKLANWLTGNLLGFSPLVAKEVVYRATGNVNALVADVDTERLHAVLTAFTAPLQARDWQIGVAKDGDSVLAYSVYPLTHLPHWERVENVSSALVAYYGAAVGADAYNEAKKPVQAVLDDVKGKLRAKIASLEAGLKDERELEYLKQSGELILAYQYTLKNGQTSFKAQYDLDGDALTVTLDPSLTPLENAQRYFDQYNRAKRAQAGVPQLIAETKLDMFYAEQLENDLRQAENYPDIDDVASALQARGWWQSGARPKRGGGRTGALRLTHSGFVIWVGRNSYQNEMVTFKHANPQDLWFHVRGVPGAHGVLRNDGRRIPEELIRKVASIVAYYSASRHETRVLVDVTRVKYVKKIKGAGVGMVTYRNEDTVTVAPQHEEILRHGEG
jgi:predicted ribosome quality control (RQC) complex YloA/Tae2 family protein